MDEELKRLEMKERELLMKHWKSLNDRIKDGQRELPVWEESEDGEIVPKEAKGE
jgi:hypothetical protein